MWQIQYVGALSVEIIEVNPNRACKTITRITWRANKRHRGGLIDVFA